LNVRRLAVSFATVMLASGCARSGEEAGAAGSARPPPAAKGEVLPGTPDGVAGRLAELTNPDPATMVLLYYDLARLAAPVDRWVEQDPAVRFAQPIDKAPARAEVRAKIASGQRGVAGAGRLRLTLDANMSDFDPSYREFTVRALSPSSVIPFQAFGEQVGLVFENGQAAQTWKPPAAEVQAIRDRVEHRQDVTADVLVQLTGAHATPQGGALTGRVLEYELRGRTDGQKLGAVKLAAD
jgi:hypothetical protein